MATTITHLDTIADHIERHIGGFANVATLTNCMTRVRLVLHDPALCNREALRHEEGIKGVVDAGEQLQIIVGMGTAAKVVAILKKRVLSDSDNCYTT